MVCEKVGVEISYMHCRTKEENCNKGQEKGEHFDLQFYCASIGHGPTLTSSRVKDLIANWLRSEF